MILNEHLQLLIKREGRIVLGKKCINLWLLSIVLIATFLSVAFSNASLFYLSEKMNDPFTNWVNIENGFGGDRLAELKDDVSNDEIQKHYGFTDVQADNYFALNVVGKNENVHYLECRFFERMNTDLIRAILAPENIINNCSVKMDKLSDKTLGFIITRDALLKLGYSIDSIPAYIDYLSYSIGADTLGVQLIDGAFAKAPMPLLAVVKRLPMNMDLIAAKYFYEQYSNDNTYPFNMNNEQYQRELRYFVSSSVGDFNKVVAECVPDSLVVQILESEDELQDGLCPWKEGKIMSVFVGGLNTPTGILQKISLDIQSKYSKDKVRRVYSYDTSDFYISTFTFLSLNFQSLDSIRVFEKYAKDNFNVQIEMAQVNSKENFNAVSVMANILSWAMIVFSIVCIIIFIVNMLQSYFQKVKKNLGTFKAFGISSAELTRVYVLILFAIIVAAIVIALITAWIVQLILPVFGFLKDGEYNYLSLWSMKTIGAISIVVVSTLVTVILVMRRLLIQTPGDLIYDRN